MQQDNDYTVILEAVVGSTVHGTAVDDGLEDLDLMAIVIERRPLVLGFATKDTWTYRSKPQGVRSEAGDIDWVGYGLRKYLRLALNGNPSVLLPLFVQENAIRVMRRPGERLRALAPNIVSKQVLAPFRGYMRQQHQRLVGTAGQKNCTRPELIERYGYDTKYAGHIIRLGLQGCELLSTGQLSLPMRCEDRELVVAVRTGKYSLAEVNAMIPELELKLLKAHASSDLPEEPSTAVVQAWMLETYTEHWSKAR